jgi:hypothetical protein
MGSWAVSPSPSNELQKVGSHPIWDGSFTTLQEGAIEVLAVMNMDDDDQQLLAAQTHHMVEGVVATNRWIMRKHSRRGAPIPALYSSGVIYAIEPGAVTRQLFANCLEVLERRAGCCKSLCAYRLAELREADPTHSHLYELAVSPVGKLGKRELLALGLHPSDHVDMLHVKINLPNGGWEDPSERLSR